MIAWSIDSMGIRGCFIDVSVDDEGEKIERFIIEIVDCVVNKHTENYIHEIPTHHIVMKSII